MVGCGSGDCMVAGFGPHIEDLRVLIIWRLPRQFRMYRRCGKIQADWARVNSPCQIKLE